MFYFPIVARCLFTQLISFYVRITYLTAGVLRLSDYVISIILDKARKTFNPGRDGS
jgi:hypothetical protein